MKKIIERTVSSLAESLIKQQVNSACFFVFYQEQIPKRAVQKYKKK